MAYKKAKLSKFIQVTRDTSVAEDPDSDDEQFVDPAILKSFRTTK